MFLWLKAPFAKEKVVDGVKGGARFYFSRVEKSTLTPMSLAH